MVHDGGCGRILRMRGGGLPVTPSGDRRKRGQAGPQGGGWKGKKKWIVYDKPNRIELRKQKVDRHSVKLGERAKKNVEKRRKEQMAVREELVRAGRPWNEKEVSKRGVGIHACGIERGGANRARARGRASIPTSSCRDNSKPCLMQKSSRTKVPGKALWEDAKEDARSHEPCSGYGKGLTKGLKEKRLAGEAAYLDKLRRSVCLCAHPYFTLYPKPAANNLDRHRR